MRPQNGTASALETVSAVVAKPTQTPTAMPRYAGAAPIRLSV